MSGPPSISVLVPTYKYARFLPEAIESVLAQKGADFELIASDDASGDGSAEILSRYAAADSRVRAHVHERNLGMVANWNWCLAQARGRYVKFLFGDDRLESAEALARLSALLDREPGAVMAVSARLILDDDSRPTEIWDELGEAGFHSGPEVVARCALRDRNLIGEPSAVLFRRREAGRGFDPQWRQVVDQELWFHLLQRGGLVYEPEPLCAFRVHRGQQSSLNSRAQIGVTESLLLTARYLDFIAMAIGRSPNAILIRRMLFHCLYYSQKDSGREEVRTPAVEAAEQGLMRRLGRPWYGLLWVEHRLTKPLRNLRRKLLPRPCPGRRPV